MGARTIRLVDDDGRARRRRLLRLERARTATTTPPTDVAPDLGPLCSGNNDGVIDHNELQFPLGVSVNYLANPSGTTATVAPRRHAGQRRHPVGPDARTPATYTS